MTAPILPPRSDDPPDDPFDRLLRSAAPAPLADDGFTARTMRAVAAEPAPLRAPRHTVDASRVLVAERRRHAAQARRLRWASGGAAAGVLVLVAAVLASLGDGRGESAVIVLPPPAQWLPLWAMAAVGALWYAWRQIRAD